MAQDRLARLVGFTSSQKLGSVVRNAFSAHEATSAAQWFKLLLLPTLLVFCLGVQAQNRLETTSQAVTAGASSHLVVVDVPNASAKADRGTAVVAVDAAGDAAGFYSDILNNVHAFIRLANGTIVPFEAPSQLSSPNKGTMPIAFDAAGDLLGFYQDGSKAIFHGFIRYANGTIVSLTAPGSSMHKGGGTFPISINANGDVSGMYVDPNGLSHGFLVPAGGTFLTVDPIAPVKNSNAINKSAGTDYLTINAARQGTGFYADSNGLTHGYVCTASGTTTTFDAAGAGTTAGSNQGTYPTSIDAAGDVAGVYLDSNNTVHGFIRSASGIITVVDAPGAGTGAYQGTFFFDYPLQFDSAGDLAGVYIDGNDVAHDFVYSASGTIATFDAPQAASSGQALASAQRIMQHIGLNAKGSHSLMGKMRALMGGVGRSLATSSLGSPIAESSGILNGNLSLSNNFFPASLGIAMSAPGNLVGMTVDSQLNIHGFLRTTTGSVTGFDAPGAGTASVQGTVPFAVNASGLIGGAYIDENSVIHGFLLTLVQSTTTTTMQSFTPSTIFGEPVTLTANVSSPAGTPPDGEPVWFMSGNSTIGSAALASGIAALTVTTAPVGTNTGYAVYGGDFNYAGSTSSVASLDVTQASVTVGLSAASTAPYGQPLAFKATVQGQFGGVATGTVAFYDGATKIGSTTLNGGSASFSTAILIAGAHSITAQYSGDKNFQSATSNTLSEAITQVTPAIQWATPASISIYTPLSATQLNATASTPGTFVYTPAAGTYLQAGTQTLSVTFTPIDAVDYAPATATVSIAVAGSGLEALTVQVNPAASSVSAAQALTVSVALPLPNIAGCPRASGNILLEGGGYNAGLVAVSNLSAQFTIPAGALAIGQDTLTAFYFPDTASSSCYSVSIGTATVQVTPPTSGVSVTLAVTSGGNAVTSVNAGAVVKLTAAVSSSGTPVTTGLVRFCDATAPYCTDVHQIGLAQLTKAGTAVLSFRPGIGNRAYKAVFAGNGTVAGTSSGIATLTVNGTSTLAASTTALAESGGIGNYGLTAQAGDNGQTPPTGTVNFLDTTNGNASLGSAALTANSPAMSWTPLDQPTLPSSIYEFSQNGNGGFSQSLAVDLNGDGIPDLVNAGYIYSSSYSGCGLTVQLGNGDGTFADANLIQVAGCNQIVSIATADFNGDGIPDLAVVYQNSSSDAGAVAILMGNGDGTFNPLSPVVVPPNVSTASNTYLTAMAIGDFNGDGIPDIAVADESYGGVILLLGNGDGSFTTKTESNTANIYGLKAIAAGDFNNDGKLDLVVGSNNDTFYFLSGNGDGTFTAPSTYAASFTQSIGNLLAADFNSDGNLDLVVTGTNGYQFALYQGNGKGGFTQNFSYTNPSTSGYFTAGVVADFSGNGLPDLALAYFNSSNGTITGVTVFKNAGNSTFTPYASLALNSSDSNLQNPDEITNLTAADFNGDGVSDLAANYAWENGTQSGMVLLTERGSSSATVTGVSVAGAGPHQVVASYTGDSNNAPSVSAPVSLYAPTPTPVINRASGTYTAVQTVTITDSVSGAQIYTTLDGSIPTTNSTKYEGPITVSASGKLSAIAVANGYGTSATASATYQFDLPATAAPVFSPAAGYYPAAVTVTLTDATPGAALYFSTDGGVTSTLYTGPFAVFTSELVMAWAIAPGMSNSENTAFGSLAQAEYAIGTSTLSFLYNVAGNERPGYTGDGGLATQAQIGASNATATDSQGNIYIADYANNVIRKVTASTGIITTVAGNGSAGFSGDSALATGAQLNNPTGLAVDSQGNIYIADNANQRIRMVSASTGAISTLASGLCSPTSIALGKSSTLIITEGWCNTVDSLNLSTNVVTRIAGTGSQGSSGDGGSPLSATFDGIFGVAVDTQGNIYLGDVKNDVIRKITATSGSISRYAGNYGCAGSGSGAVAENYPATSACIYLNYNSTSLATDSSGALYFNDGYNIRVRKVDANSNNLHTVVNLPGTWWNLYGDGSPALLAHAVPSGLSLDPTGNLYFYDGSGRVRVMTTAILPPSQQTATPAFSLTAGAYNATQVVTLSDATPGATIYYTTDGSEATVGGANIYTGPITLAASDTINAVAVAPGYQSSLMASAAYAITTTPPLQVSLAAGAIYSPEPDVSGFFPNGGPAVGAYFGTPKAIAMDGSGNYYFTDILNHAVWKVNAKTQMLSLVAGTGVSGYSGDGGPAVNASLNFPQGIAVDASGNIYIADTNNSVIRAVNASSGIISTIAGTGVAGYTGDGKQALQAALYQPTSLWLSNGNLFLADSYDCVVRMVTLSSGVIQTVAGKSSSCSYGGDGGQSGKTSIPAPVALSGDSSGNLYIASLSQIYKVNAATGTIAAVAGNGIRGYMGDGGLALKAQISNDNNAIAVDASGNLYLSVSGALRVVNAATGNISTLVGRDTIMGASSAETVDLGYGTMWLQSDFTVNGMVFDASGNLFLADAYGGYDIREIIFNNGGKIAATPVFSEPAGNYSAGQAIALSDETPDATIYYTIDGSLPSTSSAVYSAPIVVSTSELVQAIAVASGYTQSSLASAYYTIAAQAATPVFSLAPGAYTSAQTVTITDASPGAAIYYNINGSGEVTGWIPYTGSFTVASSETVTAVASSSSYTESAIATAKYTIDLAMTALPVIAPGSGVYSGAQTVTIADSTPGAAIYYTTDATVPTTSSTVYTGSFTVSSTATVNAMAVSPTLAPSGVASAQLIIGNTSLPYIYSFAGNGTEGFSGDGGAALNAEIGTIGAEAFDSQGNLYLADETSNVVRKIAAGTGIITTVAGTGVPGYSGDGAAATSATLNYPDALAFDSAGNLYIGDSNNGAIREVAMNGNISTVASPVYVNQSSLAVDPVSRNLFFASSCTIYEIVGTSTTTMSSATGCGYSGDGGLLGNATFSQIEGLQFDPSGNLYISDSGNNRVRMITRSSMIVTTVAGNGSSGTSGDGGAATSATLDGPYGIAINSQGTLYIGSGSVIRMVSGGNISLYAGSYENVFSPTYGDGGPAAQAIQRNNFALALDAQGNLYTAGYFVRNQRVRVITAPQTPPTAVTATPVLGVTSGSYASTQTVTITDSTAGTAIYISLDGSTSWGGYAGPVNIPVTSTLQAIAVAPGALPSAMASATYTITATPLSKITTVAGTGIYGEATDSSLALNSGLGIIESLTSDSAGNIYLSDASFSTIWKFTPGSGVITRFAGNGEWGNYGDGGTAIYASIGYPGSLAADTRGNVYILDQAYNVVRRVLGGIITTYAGQTGKYSGGDGGPATSAGLNNPFGIAVDSAGNLYIADTNNCLIRKVTYTTQKISTVAGNGSCTPTGNGSAATSAGLYYPTSLALDSAGNLYIVEYWGADIRKVSTTGIISTIAGNYDYGYTGDGGPAANAEINVDTSGIAVDVAGNIFLSDSASVIREINVSTGAINTISGTGILGYYGDNGPAALAEFDYPSGLAFDNAGNLYVADEGNFRIRKIAFSGSPEQVASPVITPSGGSFTSAQQVTITESTPNATIHYYVNTGATAVYSAPFTVSANSTVRAYATATGMYTSPTVSAALTFLQPQSISFVAPASPVAYGGAPIVLSASSTSGLPVTFSVLSGPGVIVGNTLTMNGVGTVVVAADQAGNNTYAAATEVTQSISSTQASPVLAWATPAAIPYGTALSATQLNATASVPGSFTYLPAAGTVLNAGQQTLSVTFTPTDTTDYTTATTTVTLQVNQVASTITWAAPAAITYGTALGAAQLNATASVPGSFAYLPAIGTVLSAGKQTLSVTFTPTDTTNYTTVTATVALQVNQATSTITWAAPAAIPYGTALGATQLNATASTAGAFTYLPAAGTVLNVGQQQLSVSFAPTDSVDYTAATASVMLTVNKAPQTITFTPLTSPITAATVQQLAATSTSSLPVTFSVLSGPAAIANNQLSFTGAGVAVVAADQAGNSNYLAAPEATQTVIAVGGVLTGSTSSLSFGSVPVTVTSASQTVILTNANTVAATGVIVAANGDFAQSSSCSTIPALGTCSINVTFTPTQSGARTGTLSVTDAQSQSLSISLSGTGTAAGIQITPASLSFGSQVVNATSLGQTINIQNTGNSALAISGVAVTGDFAASGSCATVPAGSNCSLTVTFTPTATGNRTGTVTLTDNAGSGSQTQQINLSGVGTQAGASLTPSMQLFSGTLIGSSSFALNATLSNTGSAPLAGIAIAMQGDFAQTNNCAATLAPGTSCVIAVTYVPTVAGAESGTLVVNDNLGQQNVSLAGTGLAPGASLSASQLVFGGQLVNSTSLAQTAIFTNTGSGTVTVSSVAATGSFTETDNCTGSVASGASCSINVVFTPAAAGTQTGAITITDNAGTQIINLQGMGVIRGLAISPSFLIFGAQQVDTTSQAQTMIVTNTGTTSLTLNPISVSNNFIESDLCSGALEPGASCSVSLSFSPTAVGTLSGSVQVSDTSNAVATMATASGQGTLPGIDASPNLLSFGSVTVSATSQAQTVTVSNNGTAPLNIGRVSGTGDFAESDDCSNQTLAVGGYCVIAITMTPTTVGMRTGSIQFSDNADGLHTIALSGMGQQAGVSLFPVSLAFGSAPFVSLSQVANATGTSLSVTLTNSGNAALNLSGITATGDFSTSNNCGSSVSAGSSCSITVTFVPTAVGHRTGTLTISDDAGGGTQLVSLQGDGSPAGLTLTPSVLTFGAQAVGVTSAPQTAVLSNSTGQAITNLAIVASGEFAETDNCGSTLANGSSCTLNITVTPAINGVVTGTITISAGGEIVVKSGKLSQSRRTGALDTTQLGTVSGASDVGVVAMTATSSNHLVPPSQLLFITPPAGVLLAGGNAGHAILLQESDSSGNPVSASDSITLAVTGPNSYSQSYPGTASGGIAAFNLSSATLTVAGKYTYTATVTSASGIKIATASENVNPAAAATVTANSGGGQRATINTAFAAPLQVTLADQYGNLISGGTVTFTAPATGAGATFPAPAAITAEDGTVSVTATANGSAGTYNVTASSGSATVATFALTNTQATPTITWATPAAITYGTALSGTQLNATASVQGTFTYTPAAGTVLAAGQQQLSVSFAPTDSNDYGPATATVEVQVNQATPIITWATPAAINSGTALSSTQLNATANVPGTFVYNPAAGTIPAVGNDTLHATFTPNDATDYTTATASVVLAVNASNPAPTLTTLSPAYVAAGSSAFTLTVTGTNFISGSTVYWGSTALTTQYVSATSLTASVTATQVASAGTGTITVQTPTPGGGASNSMTFEIDTAGTGSGTAPGLTPSSASVTAGSAATFAVTPPSGATSVTAACLNAPTGVTCSYSSGTLTISTTSATAKGTWQIVVVFTETLPGAAASWILLPILLLPLFFLRRRMTGGGIWITGSMALVLLLTAVAAVGCGGGSSQNNNQTHTVSSSTVVTLTVQ